MTIRNISTEEENQLEFVVDENWHVVIQRYVSIVGERYKATITGGNDWYFPTDEEPENVALRAVEREMDFLRSKDRYERWKTNEGNVSAIVYEEGRYAEVALKASIIINGASAAGLIGFIASRWNDFNSTQYLEVFIYSLRAFGFNVLLGALATGFAYFTAFLREMNLSIFIQKGEEKPWITRAAWAAHILAMVFVISTYIIFGFALWETTEALIKLSS